VVSFWPTAAGLRPLHRRALQDISAFVAENGAAGQRLASIGIAAFGPVVLDENSRDYGRVLNTPKAGWTGSNLRAALAERFAVPVVIDTDVNAAARAEWQLGAGQGVRCLAYVTVGTGIGGGLVVDGRPLRGALHPEIGHIRLARREGDQVQSLCPFHGNCVEGLVAGPAISGRLGVNQVLSDEPLVLDLVAHYLGDLAATLVLCWSPERIVWGGGVMSTPRLLELMCSALRDALAGYGVGEIATARDFCILPALADSGLEGALLLAKGAMAGGASQVTVPIGDSDTS